MYFMPKTFSCCKQQHTFIMTVQVFEEVMEHGREDCGVFIGWKLVWVLAPQKIALRERCGIPVRILNVKSCLQNFKATIKDTIIFHLGNNEIPCFTWKWNSSRGVSEYWLLPYPLTDCVSSWQYCFRPYNRWKATTLFLDIKHCESKFGSSWSRRFQRS